MNSEIINCLGKFANSFDLKDWDGLGVCLTDQIHCDYTALRGKSGDYSRDEYVSLRKKALNHLNTQHFLSNFEVEVSGERANCRASGLIMRSSDDGVTFNSHVVYEFELRKTSDELWQIAKIKQSILWNEGDSSIHSGVSRE